MRLLLVEDDKHLGNSIHRAIKSEGYACDWVTTCHDARLAVTDTDFDMIVLDWNLPDGSGPSWLQERRQNGLTSPCLMLTARTTLLDKVQGLDSGADDFLTKPFDLDELFARIRALLRRRSVAPTSTVTLGDIVINPSACTVAVKDRPVDLTKAEFDLLVCMSEKKGQYVNKLQLENALYDWDSAVTPNAIEVLISRLRKKIGSEYIQTKRGFGYKFEVSE